MTDSDLPDGTEPEPLLPAGTEAPAWVGELLASLRADDPALPDDVAERIDRALAVLTPADVLPADAEPAPPTAAVEPGPEREAATVLPIAARDRREGAPNPWGHRLLLGGVAAAAALVLGGLGTVAVIRNSGNTPANEGVTTADSGELGAGQDQVRYVASSQDYTSATLDSTARAVLAASTTPLETAPPTTPSLAPGSSATEGTHSPSGDPSSSVAPTTSDPGSASPTAVPTPSALRTLSLRAATQRPDESCVDSLAGAKDIDPLLVDEATYERRPAFVVLIATADDVGSADVWVVARTCTAGNEGVLAFARITR